MVAISLLALFGCHGPKDAADDSVAASDDSAADDTHTVEPDPECFTPADPAIPTDAWQLTTDPPSNGIWTYAMGPGGVPLYAGSHNTGMALSTDRGSTWKQLPVMITHTLSDLAVSPVDAQVVWRSAGGLLERTTDGGWHWESQPLGSIGQPSSLVYDLAVTPWNGDRLYGVDNRGQSSVSVDGGASWTTMGDIAIAMSDRGSDPYANHAWHTLPEVEEGGRVLFTDGSTLFTSDDGAASWQARFTGKVGGHSLVRDPGDPDHILLGASDGLLESFDEGENWTLRTDVGDGLELSAWSADGTLLAFASQTALYVSTDDGAHFTSTPMDRVAVEALAIVDNSRLVMSWLDGSLVSDDRGATWVNASDGLIDTGMSVLTVDPVCPHRVYTASRCSGGLLSSTDWGNDWHHVDSYFHYVMSVHFDPQDPSTVWAVSDDVLKVSRDAGETWEIRYQQYHFHAFAIDPEDSNTLLMGSVGSGEDADSAMYVYRSADAGATWTKASTGLPNSEASAHTLLHWPGNPDVVLLGTYKGEDYSHFSGNGIGMFRSTDRGTTWTATTLPAVDIAWIAAAGSSAIATTEDGLYRSTDEGVTWVKAEGPSGYMLSVDFQGNRGLALAQDGHVWRSEDAGATWFEAPGGLDGPPGSFLAQVRVSVDGTVGYATVYNKGVYRIGLE